MNTAVSSSYVGLSPEQVESVLRILNQDNNQDAHDAALISYATGLRLREILALQWSDIDFEPAQLTACDSKSMRRRTVPLCSQALEVMLGRRSHPWGPFGDLSGDGAGILKGQSIAEAFSSSCKVAGLRVGHFHVLRSSFADKLTSSGAPLATLAHLLFGVGDLSRPK